MAKPNIPNERLPAGWLDTSDELNPAEYGVTVNPDRADPATEKKFPYCGDGGYCGDGSFCGGWWNYLSA